MNVSQVMIDIETLGTEPAGVAITTVGMVAFDADRVLDKGYWKLNPAWSPGIRDKDTHDWWKTQDVEQYATMLSGTLLPWDACEAMTEFLTLNNTKMIWGYPARFDVGHLRQLYHAVGHVFPINFRDERDMTTLLRIGEAADPEMHDRIKEIRALNTKQHDALADAENQVLVVQMVLRELGIDLLDRFRE